jgi:carboxyl-terminal processing protease
MLLFGSVVGRSADQESDIYKHLGVFSDVVAHIKNDYVEEPDMKAVTLGALNGMLEAIDPFASYLNADQYREYKTYLDTRLTKPGDVGLVLSKRPGYMEVVAAVPDSPAAKAGFGTRDMIESIKGISTRDMPLAYADMLLAGTPGSTVDVSVVQVRHPEPQTITLTRSDVAMLPLVTHALENQTGYIGVGTLSPERVKEVAAAVQRMQKEGEQRLILDLRNCAAGSPDAGIALANLFLSKGRITYLKGQRVAQQNFDADPSKAITTLPLAVLTNHGTADGAEIAAAALLNNQRAQVVGERTYGDAALRRALDMDDGGAILLSVAKYYSPDGKAIQDTGVAPNTQVAEPEPQIDLDENGEPIPTAHEQPTQPKKLEDDPVVKKAIEVLASGKV